MRVARRQLSSSLGRHQVRFASAPLDSPVALRSTSRCCGAQPLTLALPRHQSHQVNHVKHSSGTPPSLGGLPKPTIVSPRRQISNTSAGCPPASASGRGGCGRRPRAVASRNCCRRSSDAASSPSASSGPWAISLMAQGNTASAEGGGRQGRSSARRQPQSLTGQPLSNAAGRPALRSVN